MIGQKGFFKTNSNVNANLGDAIISSGSTPTPTPPPAPRIPNLPSSDATLAGNAQPAPAQTKKPLNIKTILIIIVAAITGAGVAVAVILILNKKSDGEHVTVYETETVRKLSQLATEAYKSLDELGAVLVKVQSSASVTQTGYLIRDELLGVMDKLRTSCDEAETITASKFWPFPTYDELLFGVK